MSLWTTVRLLTAKLLRDPKPVQPRKARLGVEMLEGREVPTVGCCLPAPGMPEAPRVLMVLANEDFHYGDYANPRAALEAAGLAVDVAAASDQVCRPHWGSGQGADGGLITPDLTLAQARAGDYAAVVFVGGWGASAYQYAFEGTYANAAYNGTDDARAEVNRLVNEFVAQDKYVAAICHGVSVLAWARVDGQSLLEGHTVSAYAGAGPSVLDAAGQADTTRWHVEANGAVMVASGSVGDPTTVADDVIVDGRIITAEDWRAGERLGEVLAQHVRDCCPPPVSDPPAAAEPLPVLLVIANQDFYYREYAETRQGLESQGVQVVVAAGVQDWCVPHAGSGQGDSDGLVMPNVTLGAADAANYSAIVFVGGWGASSYQYAFEGTYANAAYNGAEPLEATVNELVNEFVAQDKYVAGLCHGVTVLAWARVDGVSLLEGRTVSAYAGWAPTWSDANGQPASAEEQLTRWQVEANGASMVASGSIGDPSTAADDVWVEGKIITGENYDSALYFGEVVARHVLAG